MNENVNVRLPQYIYYVVVVSVESKVHVCQNARWRHHVQIAQNGRR